MREIHVAPMTVEGNFHIGKIMEVVAADVHARWQLFTGSTTNIALVHDSWNTYGPTRSRAAFDQREELIESYKQAKKPLGLLPSADLELEDGFPQQLETQEFRDDDPNNVKLVNDALRSLKRQGFVITGVIEGEKGLYLDLDKLLEEKSFEETLNNVQIFPPRYKAGFKRSLDSNNESSYLGKIPLTKKRSFGILVDADLLDGDSYHTDPRFSPEKPDDFSTEYQRICVAPLAVLALLPYIRSESVSNRDSFDFISNGVGSSVRFNLVSTLLNKTLGVEPFKNIHLFGVLEMEEPTDPSILSSKDWAMKTRFVIFDQLSGDHKIVPNTFSFINPQAGKLEVPDFDIFIKKFYHVKHVAKYENEGIFHQLTVGERQYLETLGITKAMGELDYVRAFKRLKEELAKRAKQVTQGVSPYDQVLLRAINLFLPELK